jgi:hypothetical protein
VPNPGCLFIGHGPKTFPVTWLTGNQIVNFLIKNSPDQVEGYLDYLQPGVLDSGATTTVLAGEHHRYFTLYDSHVMAMAARGGILEIAGGGTTGMFAGVMHSHDLRHSVVSVLQLTIHGFRVTFSGDTAEVIHPDGQRYECVKQPGRAIWWVPLDQIFERPQPQIFRISLVR